MTIRLVWSTRRELTDGLTGVGDIWDASHELDVGVQGGGDCVVPTVTLPSYYST